jgi:diaminopimelate epimerase
MPRRFWKMHGLGNDFVVLDARDEPLSLDDGRVRALADRRTGIGFDQLLVIERDPGGGHAFMRIRNADGGEVEACGNGARAVGRLLLDEAGGRGPLRIGTASGPIEVADLDGARVTVDMGRPRLHWREIPLAREMDTLALDFAVGPLARPVAVSMGNPHAVFLVPDAEAVDIERWGPLVERDPLFPARTNVEAISLIGPDRIRMRVWERGVGVTRACGTGACAVAVAAARRGLTGRRVEVVLDGGPLLIEWTEDDRVLMTGPAVVSFVGEIGPGLAGPAP